MSHRSGTVLDSGHHHDDHDHDGHDHEQGSSRLAKARHALADFFGGHSHDAADQIDDALEADASGRRALWIGLAVLTATAAIQVVVALLSGSIALASDAIHNIGDAATSLPLLAAWGLARRPANSRFAFGYARSEDLAGLVVLVAILASAVFAGYEAIYRLIHPRDVTQLWAVAGAAVVGFAGNEIVAQHRIRTGRRIGSAALVADGLHARTDGLTSLAVLVSAGGVALGWKQADPIIGLVITVAILGVLRSAVKQVGTRLLDGVDPGLTERARAAVSDIDGVVAVADLKLRWIGHTLRAEVDLDVTPTLSLLQAHDVAHHAEEHLLARLPRLTAATIHTSPAGAHPDRSGP